MKSIPHLLPCLGGLLLAASAQASAAIESPPDAAKAPVVVLQAEVTIDGQQRPDLGRSFSDTLTGGFLKAKHYEVIDHLGNQPVAQAIESSTTLAPELSAVSIGEAVGARWIYVPRMVVEGDFQKLTLKKIRVSDGKVVDVFETHSNGERSTMFLLVGEALKDIYANAASDAAQMRRMAASTKLEPLPPGSYTPAAPTADEEETDPPAQPDPANAASPDNNKDADGQEPGTEVEAVPAKPIPVGLKLVNGTHVRDEGAPTGELPAFGAAGSSPPPVIKDPAIETEDKVASYVGTIASVNSEWRFCVLRLRDSEPLRRGDQLSVKTGAIVPNEITLKVTKTEGRQAVADLASSVDLNTLKVGQKVYEWRLRSSDQ